MSRRIRDFAENLTYKWRDDNSEADLLPGSLDEPISITTATGTRNQVWSYPGRQDCLVCHNANAGHVLGLRTSQMNGTFAYPDPGTTDNQIRALAHIGMFADPPAEEEVANLPKSVPLSDTAESPEMRVRSYLDANCAHCHRPNGVRANFDARFETPLDLQGLIRGPGNDNLGIAGAKIIVPGDLSRSLLYQRDNRVGTGQMPPIAKNVIDTQYISILNQWIKSLSPSLAPPAMIGNSGEGTSTDTITDGSGSYINATLFPVLSSGRLMEIRAKVGAITGSYRCAIYADNQGNSGTLLRTTATLTNVGDGWQTFPLTEPITVGSGRSYWLAIWSDDVNARVHMQSGGTVKWGQYPFGTWPGTLNFTGASGNSYCLYATGPGTVAEPPVGLVSGAFSWQPPVNAGSRYKASGLPRGLGINPGTGLISGIPNVSGTFQVRVTETVGRTSSTQSFSLIVAPFPAELVGNYSALIDRNPTVNGDLGGYLSIRVTSVGTLSGRLYTGATSYPVTGRFQVVPDDDPVCQITAGPVSLSMNLSRANAVLTGLAKVNGVDAVLAGRRQAFLTVGSRDVRGITLNVALQPAAPALGDLGQPQGNGWMRWTYARSGVVSGSGRLADGNRLTVGGIVGADDKVRFRSVLHAGKGSLLGDPVFAQPAYTVRPAQAELTLSGVANWRKLAPSGSKDRSYPAITEALTVVGVLHRLPSGVTLLGNADLGDNARIEFTDGGLANAAQGGDLSQVFRLTSRHVAVFGNATANPCGVTLKLDSRSGTFSGGFRLNDAGIVRSVAFQGILVNQTGYGFFTLPPLAGDPNSTVLSGAVTIRANPGPVSP